MKINVLPTKEELDKLFYYDETSPSGLRWNISRYTGRTGSVLLVTKGDKAGSWLKASNPGNSGCWNTVIDSKKYKVHRIIYKIFNPYFDETLTIDHIDGNPSNNCITNLRAVSQQLNLRNIRKRKDNKSGVTGVEFYQYPNRSDYFVATWVDNKGVSHSKSFAISKHGCEGAFIKAIEARTNGVLEAGDYSKTHGLRKTTLQRICLEQYEEAINEN